jgi:hypothetical protein
LNKQHRRNQLNVPGSTISITPHALPGVTASS